MQIIPAIDIIDGKCVRLTEGDYARQTLYAEDPLEWAKAYEGAGLTRLHLVDLDGAKAGRVVNWKVLERLSAHTNLRIDFGGGVKSKEDVERIFASGATWVTVGSIAVRDPFALQQWLQAFGANKFMLGADVRDGRIAIGGWLEQTAIGIEGFIRQYLDIGVQQIFCTDVGRDGKLEGPSLALYQELLKTFPGLQLIASGGVSGIHDLQALREMGCAGAIVGKAIYEGYISLEDLRQFEGSCNNG